MVDHSSTIKQKPQGRTVQRGIAIISIEKQKRGEPHAYYAGDDNGLGPQIDVVSKL